MGGTGPLLAPQEPWCAVKGECGQGRVGFAFASRVASGSAVLPPLLPQPAPLGLLPGKLAPPALSPRDAELHQGQTSPVHLPTTSTWLRAWHLKGLINAGRWADTLGGGRRRGSGETRGALIHLLGTTDSSLSLQRAQVNPAVS